MLPSFSVARAAATASPRGWQELGSISDVAARASAILQRNLQSETASTRLRESERTPIEIRSGAKHGARSLECLRPKLIQRHTLDDPRPATLIDGLRASVTKG
jgi:hypothetical protein